MTGPEGAEGQQAEEEAGQGQPAQAQPPQPQPAEPQAGEEAASPGQATASKVSRARGWPWRGSGHGRQAAWARPAGCAQGAARCTSCRRDRQAHAQAALALDCISCRAGAVLPLPAQVVEHPVPAPYGLLTDPPAPRRVVPAYSRPASGCSAAYERSFRWARLTCWPAAGGPRAAPPRRPRRRWPTPSRSSAPRATSRRPRPPASRAWRSACWRRSRTRRRRPQLRRPHHRRRHRGAAPSGRRLWRPAAPPPRRTAAAPLPQAAPTACPRRRAATGSSRCPAARSGQPGSEQRPVCGACPGWACAQLVRLLMF